MDQSSFKQITLVDFYNDFDSVIDDVDLNDACYQIDIGKGKAVVLIPYDFYDLLLDVHKQVN